MLGSKKRKSENDVANVDVTPLIDIVFLLLIFLIVVVFTAVSEIKADLTLPDTQIANPEQNRDQDVLIINLDKLGRVMVMAEIRTDAELDQMLRNEAKQSMAADGFADRPVYIRAHQSRPWGEIQDILSLCRDARIWKVSLRALGQEEQP